jgi:hypothetical protein
VDGISESGGGSGVFADNSGSGDGLLAASATGFAGFFLGDVDVDGTLSKAGGSFKIDHPLDPSNKYLYHSFVESPDMMNIYNGNVTTDAEGNAVVTLPDWFEFLGHSHSNFLETLELYRKRTEATISVSSDLRVRFRYGSNVIRAQHQAENGKLRGPMLAPATFSRELVRPQPLKADKNTKLQPV